MKMVRSRRLGETSVEARHGTTGDEESVADGEEAGVEGISLTLPDRSTSSVSAHARSELNKAARVVR